MSKSTKALLLAMSLFGGNTLIEECRGENPCCIPCPPVVPDCPVEIQTTPLSQAKSSSVLGSASDEQPDVGAPIAPGLQDPMVAEGDSNIPYVASDYSASYFTGEQTPAQSVALAPNMIGDTSAGGCGGLIFEGQISATLNHPIYACSRLNIAENNSAQVRNRAYLTYRHYHNASGYDFFSDDPANGGDARDFDTNQFTMGIERRIGENASLEVRVPINSQLNSDLNFEQYPAGSNPRNNLGDIGTVTELGNVSLILKQRLFYDCNHTWSWGLGLNLPTSPSLRIRGDVNDPTITPYLVEFSGVYQNDTINLQPFLAFSSARPSGWFSQGFLQIDAPLNKSGGVVGIRTVDLTDPFNPIEDATLETGDVALQSLLRANVGIGRWLGANASGSVRHAVMLEGHYTGSLEEADRQVIENVSVGPSESVDVIIGPLGRTTNNFNAVLGLVSQIGRTTIYNGFSSPLRDGFDRGFDFEYSLTIDRRF